MLSCGTVFAQVPAPAVGLSAAQLDQAAADVLKEVHNRGADLYNRGEPAAAYRMYEGALSAVRPFVAHHPAILKAIEDGLNETAKTDGAKIQAFRLHEVIEQVRADLKAEAAKVVAVMKPTALPAKTPEPVKPADKKPEVAAPAAKATGTVAGAVTLGGKRLAAIDVTLVSLGLAAPRVFTVTTKIDGTYTIVEPVPPGKYAVMLTGKVVPAKFTSVTTSPIVVTLAKGENAVSFDLE
jgi:hypothetical protein